jgi:hypothetical protein
VNVMLFSLVIVISGGRYCDVSCCCSRCVVVVLIFFYYSLFTTLCMYLKLRFFVSSRSL